MSTSADATDTIATPEEPPSKSRRWVRWAVPVGTFVLGMTLGFASGAADPKESEEYRAIEQQLAAAQDGLEAAEDRAQQAEADAGEAARGAAETIREAEETLMAKAAELDRREQAVAAIEQRIVQTSIEEGIWTVGVDVEPGTYRTAQALTGYCYWAIYRTGTNGGDIIDNDGPEGGFPTVTLSAGQDFENDGCGTFVKQ